MNFSKRAVLGKRACSGSLRIVNPYSPTWVASESADPRTLARVSSPLLMLPK